MGQHRLDKRPSAFRSIMIIVAFSTGVLFSTIELVLCAVIIDATITTLGS